MHPSDVTCRADACICMATLLLSSRHTEDNQALWRAAIQRGWNVERVKGLRIPELDCEDPIVLYIESLYAPTVAESLNLSLVTVPEDWLATLPHEYVRRHIEFSTVGAARRLTEPTFIKPPNDKSFAAQVYTNGALLPEFLEDHAPVILSEPANWKVEFRCFVLNGNVRTISPYWRTGQPASDNDYAASDKERAAATALAETVSRDTRIDCPAAFVIDVGQLSDGSWAIVEANAAWSSGIYGCDPHAVLDVLLHATSRA